MSMTGNEIRDSFIHFFESKGHKHIRSSSLVPYNDPTILFTNAGMNQFKDYFLGNLVPEYPRAVTAQKVMRAGGKHNDLENVGRTDRHHTFFEMLGNFSFGDYFKKDAIHYAWEYLTGVLRLPSAQLAVSVYRDDQESYELWHRMIGIPAERIGKLGEKDNFWSMGDTGPCGPCSEIHYQLRPLTSGRTVQQSLEADDGTFLEIWNLVFMQFNRETDGTLAPLPKPSIDTGMGIERIASVVQHYESNYETDLLSGLVDHVRRNAPAPRGTTEETEVSCRVIADHIRASVFLIADGVMPSNEGRGYVLRRIIRRASRHGKELGYNPGFFAGLTGVFVPMMSKAYPEIQEASHLAEILLNQEERRFSNTLNQGMRIIEELVADLQLKNQTEAGGEAIFKLYDTYGFPVDLAEDILRDHGIGYNVASFNQAMSEQRQRAKVAHSSKKADLKVSQVYLDILAAGLGSRFIGYDCLSAKTVINAIIRDQQTVKSFETGDRLEIVLADCPFYAESGGQIGDRGEILHPEFRFRVDDSQSPVPGLILCVGNVVNTTGGQVTLPEKCVVMANVAEEVRADTERNHTAAHLLQAALRNVLGEHVKQAGSAVSDERLRFDFSHYAALTRDQLQEIEGFVNELIRRNLPVESRVMPFDDAVKEGAMAIFGEKYGEEVRVISAGNASKELCGGCHTSYSGNIGLFHIVEEESIAAGIRRIEAVTGRKALTTIQRGLGILYELTQKLKAPVSEVKDRLDQQLMLVKEQARQLEAFRQTAQQAEAEKAMADTEIIGAIEFLATIVENDVDLKVQARTLSNGLKSGVVLLAGIPSADKISVALAVGENLMKTLNANALLRELLPLISGRGGGNAHLAQGGGSNPAGWETMRLELRKKIEGVNL
jgi:alanyl-tRNA synthetase